MEKINKIANLKNGYKIDYTMAYCENKKNVELSIFIVHENSHVKTYCDVKFTIENFGNRPQNNFNENEIPQIGEFYGFVDHNANLYSPGSAEEQNNEPYNQVIAVNTPLGLKNFVIKFYRVI